MRLLICALAFVAAFVSGQALAGTRTFNGVASNTTTLTTNINGPADAQQTSFTGYISGPYRYALHVFTVDQTGVYTATSTTSDVVNTT
jgi:hypothetical protein